MNLNDPTGHTDSCGDNGGGCSSNYTPPPPPPDPCDIHPEACGEDPDDELSGGIEGEAGNTEENLTFGDYMAQGLAYCPFGQVCDPAMDLFWEQLASWLMPSYASGSKNSL